MSDIDIVLQEFLAVKDKRDKAEEDVSFCQMRMAELRKELIEMGYTEELGENIL